MTKCLHITSARVCTSPDLAEEPGIVFCTDRATCQFKDDARPRHVENLHSIADRGDCAVKTEARPRHIATLLRIPGRQRPKTRRNFGA